MPLVYDPVSHRMVDKASPAGVAATTPKRALDSGNTGIYGSTIEGADPTAIDDRRFDWNDLGAGAYAVLNEGLFGIPDWLVSLSGSENVKALKNWQQQNKMATDIGATIGGLGGLLIPGGTLTKGAGKALGLGAKALGAGSKVGGTLAKGAKAADLLGDVIRGGSKAADAAGSLGKLGKLANTGVGRGVLSAVESGVPMAAADLLTGREDVGGALGNLAGGAALGGALGGVFGKIGSKKKGIGSSVERAAGDISDKLVGKKIGGLTDVTPQDIRRYFRGQAGYNRGMAATAKNAEDLLSDISKKIDAYGLDSPSAVERFYDDINARYSQLGDELVKAETDFAPAISQIFDDPDIKAYMSAYDNGEEIVKKLAQMSVNAPNYGSLKRSLNEISKRALNAAPGDLAGSDIRRVTDAIAEKVDDIVERKAAEKGMDLAEMKDRYRVAKFFEPSVARGRAGEVARVGGGSNTAEKLMTSMALGGITGGVMPGKEDDTLLDRLYRVGVGGLGGIAANKILPKLANKGMGYLAGGAQKILTPERLGGIAEAIEKATPKLESIAGAAGARGVRSATYDADAKAREAEANVTATEEATTPAAQEEAATAVNSTYADVINEKLRAGYSMYFAQDMDYETFLAEIGRRTNNFDPKMMAGILFENPDERAQYLKSYDRAMQLKEVDLQRAMGGARSRPFWESASPEEAKAYDDLVNLISSVSGGGAIPSKSEKDAIRELVGNIMAQPVSDAEKRAMIEKMLSVQFGLPVDLYRKAGIYG